VSGSGIRWEICKFAPRSRQITTPAPHCSVFLQARCPSCRPTNSVKALKPIRCKKRDAILTCDQKPTGVRLIYSTEPRTKKWRTGRLKSKNGYVHMLFYLCLPFHLSDPVIRKHFFLPAYPTNKPISTIL